MGAEEKNRDENLSRIAADLFIKSEGGEELSSKIQRLREEIKKAIESEETIFGKFLGLVESFREIIPEEKQRYHVALKALSTTSKISQQDIVKAVNNRLEELKILQKSLLLTPSGWRDELKAMEAKSREMRDEIAKLRDKMGRLESEEKEILNGMAARGKDMSLVEKAVGELFTDIAAEITAITKKVGEITAERTALQPIPPIPPAETTSISQKIQETTAERSAPQLIPPGDSMRSDIPSDEKGGGGQKIEVREASVPQNREQQKNCPMCGGRMNFQPRENKWRCYVCAYEELEQEQRGGEQKIDIRESEPSAPLDPKWQKKCPMCGGRMNFHTQDEMWICYTCAHQESEEGEVQDKDEEKREQRNAPQPAPAPESIPDPFPHLAAPSESPSSSEHQKPKKGSSASHSQPSGKKKTCPVCRKKMDWYQMEKAWRCPFCDYERSI